MTDKPASAIVDVTPISLTTLGDGIAEELFQAELVKVLENLEDPNTDHKPARSITLTLIFRAADEERRLGQIEVKCATKLAGIKAHRVGVYFGRHEGQRTVIESPRQEELFTQPTGRPRPIEPAAEGESA